LGALFYAPSGTAAGHASFQPEMATSKLGGALDPAHIKLPVGEPHLSRSGVEPQQKSFYHFCAVTSIGRSPKIVAKSSRRRS
jgi:hypothetical protein